MPSWYLPVILFILVGRLMGPIVLKRIANAKRGRTRRLVWQFSLAGVLALTVALISGKLPEASLIQVAVVSLIGLANSFACYCQWRAVAVSQSRTALYTQGDDLLCMLLGYLVLGEGHFLSLPLGFGIVLAVGSAVAYSLLRARAAQVPGEPVDKPIAHWIALYSVIWGVAGFSKRYFALDGLSVFNYMAIWYVSSALGTLFIYKLGSAEERGDPLPKRQVVSLVLPAAATIVVSNMLAYWTLELLPITVFQPIDQVTEMVFPFLIGIFVFKEGRKLTAGSKWAMALGLVGGTIIAFSYSFYN